MVVHHRARSQGDDTHLGGDPTSARPTVQGDGAREGTALLLIAAAAAYSGWMVELVVPTGLSPVVSFVSEHYVVTQPYQWAFRAADIIAGTLYLMAAAGLAHVVRAGVSGVLVAAGVGMFGVVTVADAVFVPDCVATVDRVCERRELAGRVSWHHLLHLTSSALAQLALFTVVIVVLVLAVTSGGRADRWQAAALATALVAAGLGCVALYQVRWAGVPQRLQLLAIAVGTVMAAVRLLPTGRTPDRPDR